MTDGLPHFEYEGDVYMRPLERGWVLLEGDGAPYFDVAVQRLMLGWPDGPSDGYVRLRVSVELLEPRIETQVRHDKRDGFNRP